MDRQARQTRFFAIVSCILCLFLIGASLDSIPDPPAVVQHPQQALVVQVHDSGIVPARFAPNLADIFRQLREGNARRERILEPAFSPRDPILLSHATDTSPPSLA